MMSEQLSQYENVSDNEISNKMGQNQVAMTMKLSIFHDKQPLDFEVTKFMTPEQLKKRARDFKIIEVPDYVTRELNDFDKAFEYHNPLQRIAPSGEVESDSFNDLANETIIDETIYLCIFISEIML